MKNLIRRLNYFFKKIYKFRTRHVFIVFLLLNVALVLSLFTQIGYYSALSTLYAYNDYLYSFELKTPLIIALGILLILLLLADFIGLLIRANSRKMYLKRITFFFITILLAVFLGFAYLSTVQLSSNYILTRANVVDLNINDNYQQNKLKQAPNLKVTPNSSELLDCYLKDRSDLTIQLIKIIGRDHVFSNLVNDMVVYWGNKCTVVYLVSNFHTKREKVLENRSVLASILIERKYAEFISAEEFGKRKFFIKSLEKGIDAEISFTSGYFSPGRRSIVIANTINPNDFHPLAVMMHEIIHAKSNKLQFSLLSTNSSGLEEGTTQLMTQEIAESYFSPVIKQNSYLNQVKIIQRIIDLIGRYELLNNFFNGNVYVVSDLVNEKTCEGTFRRMNNYLDESTDLIWDRKPAVEVEKVASKAEKVLENPNCK